MSEELKGEYIEFVLSSINNYKKYTDELNSDIREIHPEDVQHLLAIYQSTKLGILSDLQRRKSNFRKLNRQFKAWWSSKLLEAKDKLTIPGKKYPAVKDYTVQSECDNAVEYEDWQNKLQDAEDKYEFMKLLKEDWDSFQKTLCTINDNMKSELRSLSMDRYEKPMRQKRSE